MKSVTNNCITNIYGVVDKTTPNLYKYIKGRT